MKNDRFWLFWILNGGGGGALLCPLDPSLVWGKLCSKGVKTYLKIHNFGKSYINYVIMATIR